MNRKLSQNKKGFTIIEVLIVLAIAGLILLIVFLAVPALQRNSRNTQYKNAAAAILSAVNESVNNNNGTLPSAVSVATNGDVSVTPAGGTASVIGKTQGGYTASVGTALPTGNATGSFVLAVNHKCNGNALATGTQNRSFAVLYYLEGTGGNVVAQCTES